MRHTNKAMIVRGRTVYLAATSIEIAIADNVPDAEFIAEAFNVLESTGKTPKELAEDLEIQKLFFKEAGTKNAALAERVKELEAFVRDVVIADNENSEHIDQWRNELLNK